MGSNTSTTTNSGSTTTSGPWAGVEPYITDVLAQGQSLYNQGQSAQAAIDPNMLQAEGAYHRQLYDNQQSGIASTPMQVAQAALTSGGIAQGSQPALDRLGVLGDTGGAEQFTGAQALYNQVPQLAQQYLGGMASSDGTVNPFLNQLLDANAERIGNRAASVSSGSGRYGSAGMYDALNRSIAETNNPILSAAYENDQNRKLQAAGAINQAYLGSAGGLGAIGQNINSLKMGANTADIQARDAAANRQLNWAQLSPQLYDLSMQPSRELAGAAGNWYQQRAQAEQDSPWTQLQRYGAAVTGNAGLLQGTGTRVAGPSSSTTSTPTPWTTYAGLGLAGVGTAAKLFG